MFRLMVRSREGWSLTGSGWEPRYVWSTWSRYDREFEAFDRLSHFTAGGVAAAVIREEDFDAFCPCHIIA